MSLKEFNMIRTAFFSMMAFFQILNFFSLKAEGSIWCLAAGVSVPLLIVAAYFSYEDFYKSKQDRMYKV